MFSTRFAGAVLAAAIVLTACLAGTASAVGALPGSLREGPAGPPATMAVGGVAQPPAVTGVSVAASCPAAPYGAHFYAPGTSKTVAMTFDDGPGKSTSAILSVLAQYQVPATFFNIGENMATRP